MMHTTAQLLSPLVLIKHGPGVVGVIVIVVFVLLGVFIVATNRQHK